MWEHGAAINSSTFWNQPLESANPRQELPCPALARSFPQRGKMLCSELKKIWQRRVEPRWLTNPCLIFLKRKHLTFLKVVEGNMPKIQEGIAISKKAMFRIQNLAKLFKSHQLQLKASLLEKFAAQSIFWEITLCCSVHACVSPSMLLGKECCFSSPKGNTFQFLVTCNRLTQGSPLTWILSQFSGKICVKTEPLGHCYAESRLCREVTLITTNDVWV